MSPLDRRSMLKALAAVGAVAAMPPAANAALTGLPGTTGATRVSRLDRTRGLRLVHTDLHNHSFISGDAEGDPYKALHHLQAAGIDVACMTEHAVSGKDHGQITCATWQDGGCRFIEGINADDWETMAKIADEAYQPGRFVSFRGFEYSTPTLGHLNVWFGSDFTDPLHEGALLTPREIGEIGRIAAPLEPVANLFKNMPDTASIKPFYDWLTTKPGTTVFGGGGDAIASFNHPGYFGNFEDFLFHEKASKQIFLMETFNAITYNQDQSHGHTATDYFWYGKDRKLPQPFNACLNAGWRVGFTGVSDEHSGTYGQTGKGRGGLYVDRMTRDGVRRAIMTRRSFGTREAGLRLDATLNDVPMGSHVRPTGRPMTVKLDIDRGPEWVGKKLFVQVIGSGEKGPQLLGVMPIRVPSSGQPVVSFEVKPTGPWMFLRITDPTRATDPLGEAPFEDATYGGATAYASAWFFTPDS
jgi:hypothetical protein